MIEAAEDPAAESWRNLLAIDDVVREIVETDSHLVVSALAARGGRRRAVRARGRLRGGARDVVLNPDDRHGRPYGSEYWTYLLPRRIGHDLAAELTSPPFEPIGTRRAVEIGLLDDAFGDNVERFRARDASDGEAPGRRPDHGARLTPSAAPAAATSRSSRSPPYRAEELVRSQVLLGGRSPPPRGAAPLRPQARRAERRAAGAPAASRSRWLAERLSEVVVGEVDAELRPQRQVVDIRYVRHILNCVERAGGAGRAASGLLSRRRAGARDVGVDVLPIDVGVIAREHVVVEVERARGARRLEVPAG